MKKMFLIAIIGLFSSTIVFSQNTDDVKLVIFKTMVATSGKYNVDTTYLYGKKDTVKVDILYSDSDGIMRRTKGIYVKYGYGNSGIQGYFTEIIWEKVLVKIDKSYLEIDKENIWDIR